METINTLEEFYEQISEDIKQTHIQFIAEAGSGKTSSLRTILQYCKDKNKDIVFKIFDISVAWWHKAPCQHRQEVTPQNLATLPNLEDCVYDIGLLDEIQQRYFVARIVQEDYLNRYFIEKNHPERLKKMPNIVYIFEECNIYFDSSSINRKDMPGDIFTKFLSVGRNFKLRGFLVATAEIGEVSTRIRRRSRKIYGKLISDSDLAGVKRKDKTWVEKLENMPKYNFVYNVGRKFYGPFRIPDSVTHVPVDFVVKFNPHDVVPMVVEPEKVSKLKWFLIGIGSVIGFVIMIVVMFIYAGSQANIF